MDKNELVKALHIQITEMEAMLRDFASSKTVASIDTDIFLSRIRNLYEKAKMLEKLKTQAPEPAPQIPAPTPSPAPEPAPTPAPAPSPTPEPAPESHSTTRLSDIIQPTEGVNEIYGKAKSAGNTAENLQPVSDILVAIGLNDRFVFTRELFNNDSLLFKSTITALNNLPSLTVAQAYIKEEFNWKEENTTAMQFMQIVKRRYI